MNSVCVVRLCNKLALRIYMYKQHTERNNDHDFLLRCKQTDTQTQKYEQNEHSTRAICPFSVSFLFMLTYNYFKIRLWSQTLPTLEHTYDNVLFPELKVEFVVIFRYTGRASHHLVSLGSIYSLVRTQKHSAMRLACRCKR